jgi:hypothetical protein
MARTATARVEPEATAQPEPELDRVCGTCQHWESRHAAFGICNLSGRFLPGPLPTTNTTSCAAWQAR